jgi:hypothetical protein
MKATVGWTDRGFLVAGVPGRSAQLRSEELSTWRDFALWYTVVTEVEDGMGGGGGGHELALTLEALALQLLMLNNFSDIFTETGFPSSMQPLLVTKPPRPTVVWS